MGSISTAIGDSFYGINHRQTPNVIPINKDYFGLAFFTRPRLNLSTENLRTHRIMSPLLTNEPSSVQRYIRCMLDPTLGKKGITCSMVDDQQAFIPLFTNHLLSMTGWPDVNLPTMTSHEGMYKEAFSMVDGVSVNYSTFDIPVSFRNLGGDPITAMLFFWCHYMSLVYEGVLVPYSEFIVENEIDYQTRIYRLVLDSTKTFVKKIAATGASFPLTSPMGASFNFSHDKPINDSNDQISSQFRCMGAMYQDDILIDEFNKTTVLFNPTMAASGRSSYWMKVPMDALYMFNNRGYPAINPKTYELEWYVSKEEYAYRLPQYTANLPNTLKGQKNG